MRLRALAVAAGLLWPVSADTQAEVSYLETGNMLYCFMPIAAHQWDERLASVM